METYHEHQIIRDVHLQNTAVRYEEFADCTFENCEFDTVQAIGCKFVDCVFSGCKIANPVLEGCIMTGSDFVDCRLLGVNWSVLSSGFIAPIAHLQGCQIKYNHFVGSNYPKFQFTGNDLAESMFADCDLSHSCFRRCQLHKTEFFRCDLTGASFEGADGYVVDLATCKLKGAVFSFPEVVGLLDGLGIVIK